MRTRCPLTGTKTADIGGERHPRRTEGAWEMRKPARRLLPTSWPVFVENPLGPYGVTAIASISTLAPLAKPDTSTVERAGLSPWLK